jgi:Xaa-Pro aminopeptidase
VAARLEFEMRALGAEQASFETICAVGPRGSLPHATAGETLLDAQQTVLLDWGARLAGYCSDLTRVVALGRIPGDVERLAEVVLAAQEAVFATLRPGVPCREADAAGRRVIAEAGHERHFGHGIGHGVGLCVHEAPRLSQSSDDTLAPGMVVTVEPGIYIPGRTGVRIEEMVLITEDGHEVLTSLPRRPGTLRGLDR